MWKVFRVYVDMLKMMKDDEENNQNGELKCECEHETTKMTMMMTTTNESIEMVLVLRISNGEPTGGKVKCFLIKYLSQQVKAHLVNGVLFDVRMLAFAADTNASICK